MSLNSLINKLTSTEYFIKRYNNLLLHSVRKQFSTLIYEHSENQIDWNYLITCASLFAQSKDGKILDTGTHYELLENCKEYQKLYKLEIKE